MSQNDDLLQGVRGCYCDPVFPSNLVYGLFNILVCGLRFFCVNHIDIVIFHHLTCIAFHFVGVVYEDQCIFLISLIIAENIHEFVPGCFDAGIGKVS